LLVLLIKIFYKEDFYLSKRIIRYDPEQCSAIRNKIEKETAVARTIDKTIALERKNLSEVYAKFSVFQDNGKSDKVGRYNLPEQ
jgi:hypothetical protein